jgi:hypothetical protein
VIVGVSTIEYPVSTLSVTHQGHLMPEVQSGAADLMDELVTSVAIQLHQTAPELHQDCLDKLKDPRIIPKI